MGPASAMARAILAGSVMSRASTRRCAEAGSRSVRGVRMVAMTFQPRSRNSRAVSSPKPEEQPVISTVCIVYAFSRNE